MEIVEYKKSTKTINEDQMKNIIFTFDKLQIDGIDIIQIYLEYKKAARDNAFDLLKFKHYTKNILTESFF